MQIITNWQPRDLLCLANMPEKARSDFDYVGDEFSSRFFHYRGAWYDAHDAQGIEPDSGQAHPMGWAMRVHPGSPLALFDCIASDTYFSGVLWRFVDGGERVTVARYFS